MLYVILGQYERAINDYDEAINLDPQYSGAYLGRGFVYHELGRYEQAIEDLNKTVQLIPYFEYAYLLRANAYIELGEYNKAIEDYNEAIYLAPWLVEYDQIHDTVEANIAYNFIVAKGPAIAEKVRQAIEEFSD